MSRWPSSLRAPRPPPDCRLPGAAWAVCGLLAAATATAGGADEATALRLTAGAGRVSLTWAAPATTPDSYIVRRCTLSALRGGPFGSSYFGDCVGQGIATTAWDEAEPSGSVFYLVSGSFGGVEGSLGDSWNGYDSIARTGGDCASPSQPGPVTVVVMLDEVQLLCGSEVAFYFPADELTFVSASCTGVEAGFLGEVNADVPGQVHLICASGSGAVGSGEIARIQMQRLGCPVGSSAFRAARCHLVVGNPDCGSPAYPDQTCRFVVR